MPTTEMASISTAAKTGRRTQRLASHCMAYSTTARPSDGLLGGVGHEVLAAVQADQHRHLVALDGADLHHALLELLVGDHESAPGVAFVAQRGEGHRPAGAASR